MGKLFEESTEKSMVAGRFVNKTRIWGATKLMVVPFPSAILSPTPSKTTCNPESGGGPHRKNSGKPWFQLSKQPAATSQRLRECVEVLWDWFSVSFLLYLLVHSHQQSPCGSNRSSQPWGNPALQSIELWSQEVGSNPHWLSSPSVLLLASECEAAEEATTELATGNPSSGLRTEAGKTEK